LRNAFRHARSTRIETEITYSARLLRVRIRDNGTGIDTGIIETGREGHWGLQRMRERAQQIGARLEIWSQPGAGTFKSAFGRASLGLAITGVGACAHIFKQKNKLRYGQVEVLFGGLSAAALVGTLKPGEMGIGR
jgi:hypothetical protein